MIAVIGHGGEAAYATFLAYRHHMPWHIAVSSTFHRLPRIAAVPDIDPADGLGRRGHNIRLPCVDEAAPIDQTSAHRLDYEG